MDTRGTHESLDERMRRIVEAVLKEKEKEMRRKVVNYAGKEFNERIKDQIESTFDIVLGELIIHPRGRISPPTTVASGPVATHSRGKRKHPNTWAVYIHLQTCKKCGMLKYQGLAPMAQHGRGKVHKIC